MLITASWADEVKRLLGLTGVGQIWERSPAWYFWMSRAAGVYRLQLEEANNPNGASGQCNTGVFSMRLYPFREHPVCERFSFEERDLLSGQYFKGGTPAFERSGEIPEGLFVVGTMDYRCGSGESWSLLTLESLTAMRVRYESQRLEDAPIFSRSELHEPGTTARDVPGWDLSWPLFDRIISLHAYHHRTKPSRVALAKSPGFEHVYRGPSAGWACVPAEDMSVLSLHVLFSKDDGRAKADSALAEELARPDQEVVFDRQFTCGCFHAIQDMPPELSALNPLWWTLPDSHFKSDLASTCGCCS